MHFNKLVLVLLAAVSAPSVFAAVSDSCNYSLTQKGVCLPTSSCVANNANESASFVKGKCPNDPSSVMCCLKTIKTPNGKNVLGLTKYVTGKCLNINDCKGQMKTGLCPGNGNVRFCY